MCIEKNKKTVKINKKYVFKPFTIDKLDIGYIISNKMCIRDSHQAESRYIMKIGSCGPVRPKGTGLHSTLYGGK